MTEHRVRMSDEVKELLKSSENVPREVTVDGQTFYTDSYVDAGFNLKPA